MRPTREKLDARNSNLVGQNFFSFLFFEAERQGLVICYGDEGFTVGNADARGFSALRER